MVNSKKKMNKSTVAIVVLALLLIVSLVLTATGAWFTDKADQDAKSNLTFGKVDIEMTSSDYAAKTKTAAVDGYDIMPGDVIGGTVDVNNKFEAVYVKFTVTATDELHTDTALTLKNVKLGATALTADADGSYYGAIAKETASTVFTFDVELTGTAYGNEYQGQKLSFKVSVSAIQQANRGNDAKAAFDGVTIEGPVTNP